MPPAADILQGLVQTSQAERPAAIAWHFVLAALLVALGLGYRPRKHIARVALAAPLASVSVLAWSHANAFNAMVFGLAAALVAMLGAYRPSARRVSRASFPWATAGVAMIAFGWLYPELHEVSSWWSLLFEAPVGVVPCPTLLVVVGLGLLGGGLGSVAWSLTVAALGLFYGVFGAWHLGVSVDWVLSVGSVLLAWAAATHAWKSQST